MAEGPASRPRPVTAGDGQPWAGGDGAHSPGARLPSAHAIALEAGVSRGTVDVAHARLAVGGFVVTRGPAGMFVTSPLPIGALTPEGSPGSAR
ncbi:GntR family transcriptional regulator [Sorangium cellulosum]|uniref:HTH gntR-type domain-containing protein n=1 Tax=Sorangium cellulosum TaxID=56 RepID=A0A150R073_SORCE|nr:GntR family transcriptional regulator [Sorangium cellulosum]KYF73582.1 hypothetical protein BE15_21850 [Sorangium cellulosum]